MTVNDATAHIRAVFEARAVARAARKELAAALGRALDAGVDEGFLATELVRDSVAHGELDALLPALTAPASGPAGMERLADTVTPPFEWRAP